jgi:hypothetical protein
MSYGIRIRVFTLRAQVTSLIYCNEAKIVISGSWDKTVVLHDELEAEQGAVIKEMSGCELPPFLVSHSHYY